jgi:uncharacterized delta-60 repeat protein
MRALALGLLLLSACIDPVDDGADASLVMTVSPGSGTLIGGHSMQVAVSIDRSDGFGEAVEISAVGLPDLTSARGITIGADETEGVLTLVATPLVETGTGVVTIEGRAGDESSEVTFELTTRTQGGLVDYDFGTSGHVGFCPVADCDGTALTVQPDGKLLVAGSGWNPNHTASFFVISRLTADGEPDPDFGYGGATLIGSPGAGHGNAIVVQPDGAIVVGGIAEPHVAVVWRFHPDGTLDESFAGGRVVLADGGTVRAVALLPDGRILVAGYRDLDTTPTGFLARLRPDGSLDPDFAGDGLLWDGGALFSSVAVLPDGRFFAGGSAYGVPLPTTNALRRYTAQGEIDPSFNAAVLDTWSTPGQGTDPVMAVQSDGKVVVAYSYFDGEPWVFGAARFRADGSLDTSFGDGSGRSLVPIGARAFVKALVIDASGAIVVAGDTTPDLNSYPRAFAVARLTGDGVPDPAFGPPAGGSSVVEDVGGLFDRADARAIALQPDGGILICGTAIQQDGVLLLELVRLRP